METITRIVLWLVLIGLLVAVPRWTRTHPLNEKLENLRHDVQHLHAQAHDLELRNARMIDHIIALEHSSHIRATQAVHTYGLIGPDEILVRFDEDE